eukprot:TRINITY_DN19841_c0_g1_i4.p1 TRINITY_DN19841_c0_g1~~TRINITY_DN19841_c0_g1_i4.p1  ORF type:complete len:294 (-),score=54.08 TRINITY_DN19841_c0_g1_i4:544-1425(-)
MLWLFFVIDVIIDMCCLSCFFFFFFQAEDGIRDAQESRGLGDVYKRQGINAEYGTTRAENMAPTTGFLYRFAALIAVVLAAPFKAGCDFSQIPTNPLYNAASQRPVNGSKYCDYNWSGQYASFKPCGGDEYPPCAETFDEMMECDLSFAPHADCKFGDSFVGHIGCKYSDSPHDKTPLPDDQQPVTCKEAYSWCCPCGYDNEGNSKRTCGGIASYQEAWSPQYAEENLLPAGDPSALTLEQVQSWGWYNSKQLYMWCNIGGKCHDLVAPDDPYSVKGGCATQTSDPTPCVPKP